MSPSQSAITQRGWDSLHPAGRYRRGESAFSSPGCRSCREMEGFLSRGWGLILPWCGGTSALARGATLTPRWLHELQFISNHPVGLRLSHPAGRYRLGGAASASPCCWSCRHMEGFLNRGWELILPGGGGISALARGQLSLRTGSMSPRQSAITQWGWGFHTLRGRLRPVGSPFAFPRCRSCRCMEALLNLEWGPIPPVRG